MYRKYVILSLFLFFIIPIANLNPIFNTIATQSEDIPSFFILGSNQVTWHHDASNVSGWVIESDPSKIRLDGMQEDVNILSDGSAIRSSSIPDAEGHWHGSLFLYELETPIYVGYGFNFEVELNHPGSSNVMGGMEVGLYDQNKNISYWVSIVDSWYSSSFSTDLAYAENGETYVHTTSRSGSLLADYSVWHDEATNTIKGQDNQGTYTLATETEYDPNREIFYVGIMFWNVDSNTYESNYVLDILIEGSSASEDVAIWHDDCTDTLSFPDLATWYNGAMGSIAAENGYIYATDYGTSSGEHGPVYYHTFEPAIPIGRFDWLEAEIELDGSSAIGAAAIMLYDSDYKRIAILDVADSWIADNEAAAYAGWYDVDFNAAYTPNAHPADTLPEPYHETLKLEINSTGLYGLIPRVGDFKMLDLIDLELEREISYLCVQFRQKDSYTLSNPMRIYDIKMQYQQIAPITTQTETSTDVTTDTGNNTTLTGVIPLDITIVISIGSIAVIVVIAGVICRSKSQGVPGDTGTGYNW